MGLLEDIDPVGKSRADIRDALRVRGVGLSDGDDCDKCRKPANTTLIYGDGSPVAFWLCESCIAEIRQQEK